ncbi:MAG: hypothetical protein HYT14_02670 [Candidatus Liptonbacteria bacterium]|nr:hypothetical protein [Candidatus Liptonbacteria bacterium]
MVTGIDFEKAAKLIADGTIPEEDAEVAAVVEDKAPAAKEPEKKSETPAAEEVDYKALWEQAEQRAKSAEGRLKNQPAADVQAQIQAALAPIIETLELTRGETRNLVKALVKGDDAEVEKIEKDVEERQAQTTVAQRYVQGFNRLAQQLVAAVQDDEGNAILDLRTAPELADVRDAWNDANRRRDLVDLAILVPKVKTIAMQAQRKAERAAEAAEKKKADDARAAENREKQTLAVGAKGAPAAGKKTGKELIAAYADNESDDHEEALKEAVRLGFRM